MEENYAKYDVLGTVIHKIYGKQVGGGSVMLKPEGIQGHMLAEQSAPAKKMQGFGVDWRPSPPTPRWRAVGGEDDSNWPPFLTVFKNPPRAYAAACIVGACIVVCTLAGAGFHIKCLLSCPHSIRRSLYLNLAVLLVVLTLSGLGALCFVAVAVIFQALRAAYVGLSVLWIVELVFEMGGGFSALCYAIAADAQHAHIDLDHQHHNHHQQILATRTSAEHQPARSGAPAERCSAVSCVSVDASRRMLLSVWYCMYQYVVLSILGAGFWVVLAGLGMYAEGVIPTHPALIAVQGVQFLSAALAVGALSRLHTSTRSVLRHNKFQSTGKIVLVQGAVIIAQMQPFVLAWLMAEELIPGTPLFDTPARSALWNNLLVVFEAFLLLVLTRRGFPVAELHDPEVREALTGTDGFDALLFPSMHRSYGSSSADELSLSHSTASYTHSHGPSLPSWTNTPPQHHRGRQIVGLYEERGVLPQSVLPPRESPPLGVHWLHEQRERVVESVRIE